jgi:hypothetical protein
VHYVVACCAEEDGESGGQVVVEQEPHAEWRRGSWRSRTALLTVLALDVVLRLPRPGSREQTPGGRGLGCAARARDRAAFHRLCQAGSRERQRRCDVRDTDEPISVLGFTVVDGRIAALDLIADPAKLRHLSIDPN